MIKLLHVDDDASIREIAMMSLELSAELDVLQCSSGAEAIEKAAAFAPDVFLLDMMMPNMTGPETLRHLRKDPALASIPAVFMTARRQSFAAKGLMEIGAVAVISKPFDPMTLADQIIQAMQKETMSD